MRPFNLTLSKVSISKKELKLSMAFTPLETEQSYPMNFNNKSRSIEKRLLKIKDNNEVVQVYVFSGHMSPINNEPIKSIITHEVPFVHEIVGEIDKLNDSPLIRLDYITAVYHLKKGEPYYFYIHDEYGETNSVEVVF